MTRDLLVAAAVASKEARSLAKVATKGLPNIPLAAELRLLGRAIDQLARAVKSLGEALE